MVEDEQSQPLKRIRFEEEDEDRISKLPDCLLVEILSRLPDTKDAIITGTLSKRWIHIWTTAPNLVFLHPYASHCYPSPDFISFVDKTLTQRPQSKLNKFRLHSRYNHRLESHIHNWIRYAVNCNVEDLNLTLWGCSFNPIGAISWNNLRSLCISHGKLDEDLIENILSGSPVLETLVLKYCYGYRRLNITSKSVKKLVFTGYMIPYYLSEDHADVIEINAPNISSLTIQDDVMLRKLLLLSMSSLVEADLDYRKRLDYYERITKEAQEEAEEEMLKGFILKLLHVKDLKIGFFCFKVLDRLEAKGFISPSNLKVLDVPLYSDNGATRNQIS